MLVDAEILPLASRIDRIIQMFETDAQQQRSMRCSFLAHD
jgi:hypothetical protein